ncbi:U2 snRNP-associated SURP motif-containing protein [Pseudocercospora fuligena]|uniref:U2 snRNP-associated SURP motif-containing protein n=1 Tax=Pseudocercospora fuligena TaxID=685502 RepID=A0A8H6VIA1_9PEZI|nr:U2 snRNP-associated SURP motif-containing protein [Pseudocercospora fuligena]
MAEEENPKEFPDVKEKLSAPKKLSAFEKERLAQEEKRRREQAEAAAALKDFEDSFGGNDDDDYDGFPMGARGSYGASRGAYGGSRGGFGGPPRSGPGSLGPVPGPPPSLKRKRALDELREQQEARREQEAFAREYMGDARRDDPRDRERYAQDEEVEPEEDTAPRPTIQLSGLPLGTTEHHVRTIVEKHLSVHSVLIQPQSTVSKYSATAIATLSPETASTQIDTAVSALRDKYLGCGYRLSCSRHLSSTALQPGAVAMPATDVEPFGAQKVNPDQPRGGFNMRNAPPPSHFAPPDSYEARSRSYNQVPQATANIAVQPPIAISTIRAIHTIADRLLSESSPRRALQLESGLMAMPDVQNDERFAFLFDSQSPAGIYYRYLMWNDDENLDMLQEQKRMARGPERVIDDVVIDWNIKPGEVPFADLSRLGDALDHPSYVSSDEESDDEEERKFNTGRREGEGAAADNEKKYLSPLKIAKFAWLLSRVPATHTRLRVGDVAAISTFAINNAGVGADEIVDMLMLNIEKPFSTTQCGKFDSEDITQDEEDDYEPDEELPSIEETQSAEPTTKKDSDTDPSQSKLVALYLINDVLQNSATAGVRNAWRYRQLFEAAFRRQHTFKQLGRLGKELGWGRIKENQWQNKVRVLFDIWEHGSVFASDVFEAMKKEFFEQPAEEPADDNEKSEQGEKKNGLDPKHLAKFKRIEGTASPVTTASPALAPSIQTEDTDDVDGEPMQDLDGTPMDDLDGTPMDEDLDGEPMNDLDGSPMAEPSQTQRENDGTAMEVDEPAKDEPVPSTSKSGFSLKSSGEAKPAAPEPRRRKHAEDMFADSDED